MELNWMRLKRSVGNNVLRPVSSASRACSIDEPDMDPEVSMMKITSRLERSVLRSCGGMNISSTCSPASVASLKSTAAG